MMYRYYTVQLNKFNKNIRILGGAKSYRKIVDNFIFKYGRPPIREEEEFAEFNDRLIYVRPFEVDPLNEIIASVKQ